MYDGFLEQFALFNLRHALLATALARCHRRPGPMSAMMATTEARVPVV